MCSIVDRNPVSSDDIRRKLNDLVERVRLALLHDWIREQLLHSVDSQQRKDVRAWVKQVSRACEEMQGDFFIRFAGQGRVRWHYGAAHPILSDIEDVYVADEGRDWLHHEEEARTKLVLGKSHGGLDWVDYREIWQILSGVLIVGSTCGGAFILSFFTPTVGLGCRSGGYTIFACVSFGLLVSEMLAWWCMDAGKPKMQEFTRKMSRVPTVEQSAKWIARVHQGASGAVAALWRFIHDGFFGILGFYTSHERAERLRDGLRRRLKSWEELTAREKLEWLFFRPAEFINTVWLIYITMAQTLGAYVNCRCMTST